MVKWSNGYYTLMEDISPLASYFSLNSQRKVTKRKAAPPFSDLHTLFAYNAPALTAHNY